MAKYTCKDNELRKALIDFISNSQLDESEDEDVYRSNMNTRAIINDVTGSLGVWGIKQP